MVNGDVARVLQVAPRYPDVGQVVEVRQAQDLPFLSQHGDALEAIDLCITRRVSMERRGARDQRQRRQLSLRDHGAARLLGYGPDSHPIQVHPQPRGGARHAEEHVVLDVEPGKHQQWRQRRHQDRPAPAPSQRHQCRRHQHEVGQMEDGMKQAGGEHHAEEGKQFPEARPRQCACE